MRKILFILLLLPVFLFGQGPGHYQNFPLPDYYSAGGTGQIGIWFGYDSVSGPKHPLRLTGNGASEQGTTNNADSSLAWLVSSTNWTGRATNAAKSRTSTYIVAVLHVTSGGMNMKWYKNMYRYMTTVWGSRVDLTQVSMDGLSLSGGAVVDFIGQVSDSMVVWTPRISCFLTGSAASPSASSNAGVLANINTYNIHYRQYYCDDDGNTFSQSQNTNFSALSRGFSPGNTYTHKPDILFKMTGNHTGGWSNLMTDTTGRFWLADSTVEVGGSTNRPYHHTPTGFEYALQFQSASGSTNVGPTANAGADQNIQQPATTATLNASGSFDPDGVITAYQWTKLSGAGTITSATSSSTGVTGLTLGSPMVIKLQVTDDSSATALDTVTLTVITPTGTYLKPYDFFDFAYSGVDRNHPKNFFDNNTATEGTPRKMQDYYGFNKSLGANHTLHYWTKWGQCRGWLDMVGDTSISDTTHKVKVYSIKGYSTGPAGYKVYFFNGDKFWRPAYHNRWKAVDDPYAYGMLPFDSLTTVSSPGWVSGSMTIPDSMRYVFMIITGDTTSQNLAKFGELIINGTRLYDSTTINIRPGMYTGAMPSQLTDSTTYGAKNGINWFNGYGPNMWSMYSKHRFFFPASLGDTATGQGIPTKYHYPFGYADFNTTSVAAMNTAGKEIYLTNQGGSAYNIGFVYVDTINKPISDPNNHMRPADYHKQLALATGRHTSGTNKFLPTTANGQGLMKYQAVGNENDGHDGQNNVDIFAFQTAVYDGNESSIIVDGAPTGIKNGDPTMQVVMAASVHFDTMRLKSQFYYGKMFRADGFWGFNAIDLHRYLAKVDSTGGIVYDLEDKVGSYSSSPEMAYDSHNGLQKYIDTLMRRIYKYYPITTQIWWSETGRSKYGTVSANPTQAGSWDESVTPGFGTYDSLKAASVLNFREAILTATTPFRRRYYYSADNSSGSTQGPGRFASMGIAWNKQIVSPFEFQSFYPDWFINASARRLNNFASQSTVLNGSYTGRWQLFWRKPSTDSVCELTWYGTRNGTSASVEISLATGYKVTRTITELPTLYFYKESNPTVVSEVIPSFTSETPTTTSLTATVGSPGRYQLLRVYRKP